MWKAVQYFQRFHEEVLTATCHTINLHFYFMKLVYSCILMVVSDVNPTVKQNNRSLWSPTLSTGTQWFRNNVL